MPANFRFTVLLFYRLTYGMHLSTCVHSVVGDNDDDETDIKYTACL